MTSATIICRAASALSFDAPNSGLARATGSSRAAARKHRSGERRPTVKALRRLQEALREQAQKLLQISADLDSEIWMRQRTEPRPGLRGCCARDWHK
jgi:hypothetical protein